MGVEEVDEEEVGLPGAGRMPVLNRVDNSPRIAWHEGVLIEPLTEAEFRAQVDPGNESRGPVAAAGEDLRQSLSAVTESFLVIDDAVGGDELRCDERHVGGQRPAGWADGILESDPETGEPVQGGRRLRCESVATESIGSQGVDGDDDDVRGCALPEGPSNRRPSQQQRQPEVRRRRAFSIPRLWSWAWRSYRRERQRPPESGSG